MKIVLEHKEILAVLMGYLGEKTDYSFGAPHAADCYFEVESGDPIEKRICVDFVWDTH